MSSESSSSVGGVAAGSVAQPMNTADLATVMRHAAHDRKTVVACGGRSKIDWGTPPSALDLLVRTSSMDRILDHAAGDLVVTAQAGAPLAALQEQVAGAGQWLALDPPEPGATVGGVVAAAASGPRRLRYGTPRDLLIGITIVLADGTVARSGGKVVKNVAGYDLGKLFTGSFGTLGVIAECTFRLHPRPAVRRVVSAQVDDPVATARRVFATGATPAALEWDGATMTAVIESVESAAQIQAADVATAMSGEIGDQLPAGFGVRPWQPAGPGTPGGIGVKITHRLGGLRQVLRAIRDLLPAAQLQAHVGSGVIWLATEEAGLGWLGPLRERVADHDGGVVVVQAPAEVKRGIDVWGPVRGLDVMRQVKAQFDPDGRMSPGRFVGGI